MDRVRGWRGWWPFGLLAVGLVVAGLAGLLVPHEPSGHWSGHVGSGLIAAGQLVALLVGGVLARRRLSPLLLLPLAAIAAGLILEVVGNLRVATSIWRTPYGDEEVARIGSSFAGFDAGHALAGQGDLLVVLGGIAFAVILGLFVPPPLEDPIAGPLLFLEPTAGSLQVGDRRVLGGLLDDLADGPLDLPGREHEPLELLPDDRLDPSPTGEHAQASRRLWPTLLHHEGIA